MKHLYSLLFLLLPFAPAAAQDTLAAVEDSTDTAVFIPHHFMEIYMGPSHVNHAVFTPDGVFNSQNDRLFRAFTVGVGFHRQQTKRFSYRIGAEFHAMELATKRLYAGRPAGNGSFIDSVDYTGIYKQANFPVMAGWSIIVRKKMAIGFSGGFSPQVKVDEHVPYMWHYTNGGGHGNSNAFRKGKDRMNADVRAVFFIEAGGPKTKVLITPYYRYELFSTFRGVNTPHVTSFGVNAGCMF